MAGPSHWVSAGVRAHTPGFLEGTQRWRQCGGTAGPPILLGPTQIPEGRTARQWVPFPGLWCDPTWDWTHHGPGEHATLFENRLSAVKALMSHLEAPPP